MISSTADVAQLVESQIVILVVAGSSPVVRPISIRLLRFLESLKPQIIYIQHSE